MVARRPCGKNGGLCLQICFVVLNFVFLGNTLYSCDVSLHPSLYIDKATQQDRSGWSGGGGGGGGGEGFLR